MDLTPEQEQIGRDNYYSAVTAYDEIHRRDFLKKSIAGGAGIAAGIGAMYFGYNKPSRPIRVGVIGTGDEGNVLMGATNPEYVEIVSICDIRPSSIHRAFHGDWSSPAAAQARPGLMSVYDHKTEDEARKQVTVVEDYQTMLADERIEGVIIAVPLHVHAKIALDAMRAGKHVLVEKLMAHNVAQCKLMARTSNELRRFLSVGHQRHYSLLYDNAVNMIKWGLLGEVHHIRAQWHRGNLPGADSWAQPMPGGQRVVNSDKVVDKIKKQLDRMKSKLPNASADDIVLLKKQIAQWTAWDQDKDVDAAKFGYLDAEYNGHPRPALEELIRWRLWDRTGGGLMAELGSHQLDAASIFISALGQLDGKHGDHHVRPLTVHAVGGRHIFPPDRDAADHVYCMFEFPGQGYEYEFPVGYMDEINQHPSKDFGIQSYEQNNKKKIVVTYSSINGNGYGGYGEIVMGSRGQMQLEREKDVLIHTKNSNLAAGVKGNKDSAVLDTSASGDPSPAKAAETANGPVSRGYREEIEHWAWCISTGDWSNQPRCNGAVALGDAVIALTANLAIKQSQVSDSGGFVKFDPLWFDVDSDAVPETMFGSSSAPTIESEKLALG